MPITWFTGFPVGLSVRAHTQRRERSKEVFSLHSSCIAYGNEPTSTTVYSGVVLLLEVRAGVGANTQ